MRDLLAGDNAGQFGGLSFNLRDVFALDDHFGGRSSDLQRDVHSQLVGHIGAHVLGLIFLKTCGGNDHVVVAGGNADSLYSPVEFVVV